MKWGESWPTILLLVLLTIPTIYCFFRPLVPSTDSSFGFLAYKGSQYFHAFNVVQVIPTEDIGKINPVFESWWSPGQWIFPGILNFFFGLKLGMASIWITLAALISGLIGYSKVFAYYKFPHRIIQFSLLVIFSGSTLYWSFVVYQGGEVLEFGIFPWFLFYIIRIRKLSFGALFWVTLLFLLCFIGKTTLILYCSFALLAKSWQMNGTDPGNGFKWKNWILLFPAIFSLIFIWIFFLSLGPRPVLIHHFDPFPQAVLVPLSSPISSIVSIQQWAQRIDGFLTGHSDRLQRGGLILNAIYLLLAGLVFFIFRLLKRMREIDTGYLNMLFILYCGLLAFFIFAYLFHANIDLSSRHFKLMGYFFVPGLLSALHRKWRPTILEGLILLLGLVAILDIFYLKGKWTTNRYLSNNYFYRNANLPGSIQDKLDAESYKKLLDVAGHRVKSSQTKTIFYVESSPDIGMDLPLPVIFQTASEKVNDSIYHKNGPQLLICISKSRLAEQPGIIQIKFPDYSQIESLGETANYRFFLANGHSGDEQAR